MPFNKKKNVKVEIKKEFKEIKRLEDNFELHSASLQSIALQRSSALQQSSPFRRADVFTGLQCFTAAAESWLHSNTWKQCWLAAFRIRGLAASRENVDTDSFALDSEIVKKKFFSSFKQKSSALQDIMTRQISAAETSGVNFSFIILEPFAKANVSSRGVRARKSRFFSPFFSPKTASDDWCWRLPRRLTAATAPKAQVGEKSRQKSGSSRQRLAARENVTIEAESFMNN